MSHHWSIHPYIQKWIHQIHVYYSLKKEKNSIENFFWLINLHIWLLFYTIVDKHRIYFSMNQQVKYPHWFHFGQQILFRHKWVFPSRRNDFNRMKCFYLIRTSSTATIKLLCSCKSMEKNGCRVVFIGSWVKMIPFDTDRFYWLQTKGFQELIRRFILLFSMHWCK